MGSIEQSSIRKKDFVTFFVNGKLQTSKIFCCSEWERKQPIYQNHSIYK